MPPQKPDETPSSDPPAAAAGALAGRHAVVTGGGRGIGAAVAEALHRAGARVTLMGRDRSRLDAQAERLGGSLAVTLDVTDEARVPAAFAEAKARFGPVAILVNNAGAAESSPFGRSDLALFRRLLEVNLLAAVSCSQTVLPDMLEHSWGRIVNIASTAGLRGYPYVSAYCAAKHALVGVTRALALELAASGVTVNAVCPGYTRTDLLDEAVGVIAARTRLDREQALARLTAANPQGRLVEPFEVADAVLWLCRPESRSLTGASVAVAGGEVT